MPIHWYFACCPLYLMNEFQMDIFDEWKIEEDLLLNALISD